MHHGKNGKCCCSHHFLAPALISLIGLTILLSNIGIFSADYAGKIWPVLLIALGVMKMLGRCCKCCSSSSCNNNCKCNCCGNQCDNNSCEEPKK